jgi:hypothetical protein
MNPFQATRGIILRSSAGPYKVKLCPRRLVKQMSSPSLIAGDVIYVAF